MKTHIFMVLMVGMMVACAPAAEVSQEAEAPRGLRAFQVVGTDTAVERRYSTELAPANQTQLAFEAAGTLASLNVEVGAEVRADQILAQLDDQSAALQLQQAEAGLREAEVGLDSANANLARQETLYQRDLVSDAAIENGRAERDAAAARVDQARQSLRLAQRGVSNLALLAPFAGTVSDVHVEAFQTVGAGQTVVSIFNDAAFEAAFTVPANIIDRISINDPAQVAVEGEVYSAVISEIGLRSVAASAFPLVVTLIDPPASLRAGMTAEVIIRVSNVDETEGFLVPLSAIAYPSNNAEGTGVANVFVYDEAAGVVRIRRVVVGGVRENQIIVIDGVRPGDIIASAGVSFLRDGQPVTLLPLNP